jgi:hypothetical protein
VANLSGPTGHFGEIYFFSRMRELRGFWRIVAVDRFCGEGRDASLPSDGKIKPAGIAQRRTERTQSPSTPGRAIHQRDRKIEGGQSLEMTGVRISELRKRADRSVRATQTKKPARGPAGSITTEANKRGRGRPGDQTSFIRVCRSGLSGGGRNNRRRPTSTRCKNQLRRYRLRDGHYRSAWCLRRAGELPRRWWER